VSSVPFANLLVVVVVGLLVPFVRGFAPRIRVPSAVIELSAGIVIGPFVLGIAHVDATVNVIATLGLAFLLFLGGLEIELDQLRGSRLRGALLGFGLSVVLALVAGFLFFGARLVADPILVAVLLVATSLGVVVPVLKDAGVIGSELGQQVVAGSSVADFGAIVLLALLFGANAMSRPGASVDPVRVGLLVLFAGAALAVVLVVQRAERFERLVRVVAALGDTTAQIRVRATVVLLVGLVVLAQNLGLELILGSFVAGVIVAAIDRDEGASHPLFRTKLAGIGFGVFVPVFFVSSGMTTDVHALVSNPSGLVLVPLFLLALLVVRGAPALLIRPAPGRSGTAAAALLQATSLPFIVAATQIGLAMGALDASVASALVAAGLTSVLLFPAAALTLLASSSRQPGVPQPPVPEAPSIMEGM
jgi:Kef-type K+ transport system membrane component KefB